jgi:HAE1 family hydrophobic/amphiphilic exporter-1
MERSLRSLIGALALAVFLVYVVMASQFESLLQPLVILLSIPLSVVGVVPMLWITRTPISVMTSIGMIVLAGIVVNNAIVLLDQVNRLRSDGMKMNEALIEGGRKRLRPILMTTLTTVLALIPVTGVLSRLPGAGHLSMLVGSGEGSEIRAPLALTVIGGLMASTLLTLLVVPVFASLVDIKARPREQTQ